jgi:hypothetical protein
MSGARRSEMESGCWPPTRLDAVRELKRREWPAAHEQTTQLELDHYLQQNQSGMGSP